MRRTKDGKKKLDSVMHIGLGHNDQARRGLSDAEYEALLDTLGKVIANLEESGPRGGA